MLPTLRLADYPRRVGWMTVALGLALAADFVSKELAVAAEADALLFNPETRSLFGLGAPAIVLAAAASLVACLLPARAVAVGAGAALGGALGNLTSRARWGSHGGTPDFIPMRDGWVGNVADLAIAFGAATMLLGALAWLVWQLGRSARRAASE